MPDPTTATVFDSFGLDDQAVSATSPTNESIKDRQAKRRLVEAGVLSQEQRPRPARVLTPIVSANDAPEELRPAAASALSMPSPADED